MTQSRPVGVTLLAILAGFAAVVAAIHTLQFLHVLPFFAGPLRFFEFDFFAAVLWAGLTAIYVWVAKMLWELNPQGWLFAVIVSFLNLIFDFVALIAGTSFEALLPGIILSALILAYCLWPKTREAFGQV
jgi:The Golgi pH Regulator (GPHR) Family N-terminal